MGKEQAELAKIRSETENDLDDPIFGKFKKKNEWYPKGTQIRYFVGCLQDDATKDELESIMTKSLTCAGNIKNSGDIFVITEQGTFDKEGSYHVSVKYLYLP